MDPSPFVRLTVKNLAIKFPLHPKPTLTAVHPSTSPSIFCKIKLKKHSTQNAVVPFLSDETTTTAETLNPSTSFHLSKSDVDKLTGKSSIFPTVKKAQLRVYVYVGKSGATCGLSSGRLLGKIELDMDLSLSLGKTVVFQNGWVCVSENNKKKKFEFHLCVKSEPDPRFVFGFDGDPVSSPQVSLIRGTNVRQPVFTCKFGFRMSDRHQRTRSLPTENSNGARSWLSSFGSERERNGKERKGWSITIHDLSGSPVAAASMVTPFVASPGSDRVSRSNPGCWLILRPGNGTWKPWGRLEAWRERGSVERLGYRFELIPESADVGIVLAESMLSCSKGGKFVVDLNGGNGTPRSACASPGVSPRSSGDFGYGLWPYCMYRGFVMSASVEGEGKGKGKVAPVVEVSVQHVNCTEDAAAFVALAAALDLSMDACRLFSQKLRKELCQPRDLLFS